MVQGVTALAKRLGFTRKTIYEWRAKHQDCPESGRDGTENVSAWERWLEDHPDIGLAGVKPNEARAQMLIANLSKRNALLDIDIEEARGRLIETQKVAELLSRYLVQAKQSLYKRFGNELPGELAGQNEIACKKKLDAAIARHLGEIRTAFSRVTTDAKTKRARSISVTT